LIIVSTSLGVSIEAAFGASIALLFDVGAFGVYSIPVFAFAGAVLTLFAVIYLSAGGGLSSNNLILSGIIVAAILPAESCSMAAVLVAIAPKHWPGKLPWSPRIFISTSPLPPKKS
jgi:ABC-type Fe3+-siderophore transport system permease subunit